MTAGSDKDDIQERGRKKRILALYDRQLSRLTVPWRDVWVQTSFGKTHVVETGNPQGEPLLAFHGGNATTAYNLLACGFLMEDFHIYGVDIIAKAMCEVPDRVKKAVLYIPAGIRNAEKEFETSNMADSMVTIVFKDKAARNEFMKEIHVEPHELYITVEQVRRLMGRDTCC